MDHADERNPARGSKPAGNNQGNPRKPKMKSPKAPLADRERSIVPLNKEVVSPQYQKAEALDEKTPKEVRDSDADKGQTPITSESGSRGNVAAPLDNATVRNYPAASLPGVQASSPGNGMGVTIAGSGAADAGAGPISLIDRIRASIEKAKRYPAFAKERGQKGIVLVEFAINERGRPENIRVLKSSGYSLLDTAARETIIRAAPFPVVKGSINVSIAFTINKDQ